MKIIILGANGMLGRAIFKRMSMRENSKVIGVVRSISSSGISEKGNGKLVQVSDLIETDKLKNLINKEEPQVIINCVGFVKQKLNNIDNNAECVLLNSYFPHYLNSIVNNDLTKLIHFSTDCVFSGKVGAYSENDRPDAEDIYGASKLLGELVNSRNVVTIRTSIIGHEYGQNNGILEWLLSQSAEVDGYANVYFSGLTTPAVARILDEYLVDSDLWGLYHLAGPKISKYELLKAICSVYEKDLKVNKKEVDFLDRSLNSQKFDTQFKRQTDTWHSMITEMKELSSDHI